MTADSQWPFQQAVYTALLGDATLQGFIGNPARVYDHVPQDSTFPYVVAGESSGLPWDTKDSDGMEQTLMVHTWSRYRGSKEVKQIMSAIVDVIDQQALSVMGHTLVQLRFEFSDILLDLDGLTRHGVQRFRAMTDEV